MLIPYGTEPNLPSIAFVKRLGGNVTANSVRFCPFALEVPQLLFCTGSEVKVFDTEGENLGTIVVTNPALDAVFSPSDPNLVSVLTEDIVWEYTAGYILGFGYARAIERSLVPNITGEFTAFAVAPKEFDGDRHVAVGLTGNAVAVFGHDYKDKYLKVILKHKSVITSLEFNPHDPSLLATGCENGTAAVVHWPSGQTRSYLKVGESPVQSVCFHPLLPHLVATAASSPDSKPEDTSVQVWDWQQQRVLASISGHAGLVSSLAFSPHTEELLLTGGHDGTIRVWDWRERVSSVVQIGVPVRGVAWCLQEPGLLASAGDPVEGSGVSVWRATYDGPGSSRAPSSVPDRIVSEAHRSTAIDMLAQLAISRSVLEPEALQATQDGRGGIRLTFDPRLPPAAPAPLMGPGSREGSGLRSATSNGVDSGPPSVSGVSSQREGSDHHVMDLGVASFGSTVDAAEPRSSNPDAPGTPKRDPGARPIARVSGWGPPGLPAPLAGTHGSKGAAPGGPVAKREGSASSAKSAKGDEAPNQTSGAGLATIV